MASGAVRVGVGSRFVYDGLIVQIVELNFAATGTEVVVVVSGAGQVRRMALRELLDDTRARIILEDDQDTAAVLLAQASDAERAAVRERAE